MRMEGQSWSRHGQFIDNAKMVLKGHQLWYGRHTKKEQTWQLNI
jgi:hypothetical protein